MPVLAKNAAEKRNPEPVAIRPNRRRLYGRGRTAGGVIAAPDSMRTGAPG